MHKTWRAGDRERVCAALEWGAAHDRCAALPEDAAVPVLHTVALRCFCAPVAGPLARLVVHPCHYALLRLLVARIHHQSPIQLSGSRIVCSCQRCRAADQRQPPALPPLPRRAGSVPCRSEGQKEGGPSNWLRVAVGTSSSSRNCLNRKCSRQPESGRGRGGTDLPEQSSSPSSSSGTRTRHPRRRRRRRRCC